MQSKNLLFILLLISSLLNFSCRKDEPDIENLDEFEEFLTDELDAQDIPAMSVLIFRNNNVIYEKYLGKSNIQQNLNLANNHLFLLASISKVVTATALLQLEEDGNFSLDDNINDYLPFNVNVPGYSKQISFKMLLTHTSGIADGSALDSQYFDNQDSPIQLSYFLENYLKPGGIYYNANENFYDFEPGEDYEYSNIGSALIALLVEEISGMDFNTYCKQNIFTPLGMTNTFWRLDEISQTIVTPYDYSNGRNRALANYTFTDYPNGGLRSTGRDLLKLINAFNNGGISNNHQLLKSSTVNAVLSSQIPSIDSEVGLHMFIMNKEFNLWGHDGGEKGVATIMAFNPSTKIGAIILTNQGDAELDEILKEAYKIGLSL